MPRAPPNRAQNLLAGFILPLLSLYLIPVSLSAVVLCILQDKIRALLNGHAAATEASATRENGKKGCVIISGGRMSKGLHLARAFKRAGWEVIGVEEQGYVQFLAYTRLRLRYSKRKLRGTSGRVTVTIHILSIKERGLLGWHG